MFVTPVSQRDAAASITNVFPLPEPPFTRVTWSSDGDSSFVLGASPPVCTVTSTKRCTFSCRRCRTAQPSLAQMTRNETSESCCNCEPTSRIWTLGCLLSGTAILGTLARPILTSSLRTAPKVLYGVGTVRPHAVYR